MREGTLLSEATPTELLTSCNCSYLEEAFLKICQNHVANTKTFKIPVKQVHKYFFTNYLNFHRNHSIYLYGKLFTKLITITIIVTLIF